MAPPYYIYGLFDKKGVCHYVGRTQRPKCRKHAHSSRFPTLNFEILTPCDENQSREYELDYIRLFESLGQCQENKDGRSNFKIKRRKPKTKAWDTRRQNIATARLNRWKDNP